MYKTTNHFCKPILFLLSYNQHFAQNILDSISTNSPSCNMVLAACEGDTIALVPQNRPNYTNYRWYRNTVSVATKITAANAMANNVVATNFNSRFPTLFVISTDGMYILTSQYSFGANCSTLNDTFRINYAPRTVAQVTVNNPTVCIGGSRTLNSNILPTALLGSISAAKPPRPSQHPPSVFQLIIVFKCIAAIIFAVSRVRLSPFKFPSLCPIKINNQSKPIFKQSD
jgi:hypothetical protein